MGSKVEISRPTNIETRPRQILNRFSIRLLQLALGAGTAFGMPGGAYSERVSPLANAPDWSRLDVYQRTILREDFAAALSKVYTNGSDWKTTIKIFPDRAEILKTFGSEERYTLEFLPEGVVSPPSQIRRFWRIPAQLPPLGDRPVLLQEFPFQPHRPRGRRPCRDIGGASQLAETVAT